MSEFKLKIQEFKTLLYSGNAATAEQSLLQISARDKTEHRILEHQKGICLMRRNNFTAATAVYEAALRNYGSNIGLLMDLACAYYLAGQFSLWKKAVQKLVQEFKENESLLSSERIVSTLLNLGKFLEEDGEILFAVDYYQRALLLCESQSSDFFVIHHWRLVAQIVRLGSQYPVKCDIRTLHSSLVGIHPKDADQDLDFEIGHALLITEIKQFGFEFSKARLEILLNNPICLTAEVSLIYSDVVTHFMIEGFAVPPEVLQKFAGLKEKSRYDQVLLDLVNDHKPTLAEIILLKKELPASAYLRLLKIISVKSIETGSFLAVAMMALRSISNEAQNIWIQYLGLNNLNLADALSINQDASVIQFQNKTLDIKNFKAGGEILKLMLQPGVDLHCTSFVQALWPNLSATEANLTKLRMRVYRLNKFFREELSLPKVIEIKDGQLAFAVKVIFDNPKNKKSV